MFGWIMRFFLVISGFIASLFVARDAVNFSVIQMVIAVILFTLFVILAAFWPVLKNWLLTIFKKNH